MRVFLSHSSQNKDLVCAVHAELEKASTWLDRAEIEWGDLFIEKIADGIESASDFVLFWSAPAQKSEWVRLEVNMAFIQALRQRAIRLRVILLDNTRLPLYLQPYQSFSVIGSSNPVKEILDKLTPLLREPVRSARAKFINRNEEISKIEGAIDDPDVRAALLFGFTGIGKSSLVQEATQRLFAGADPAKIDVSSGTGFVELALALDAAARHAPISETHSPQEIERQNAFSIETLAKEGRILCFSNVQHWLNEDGEPVGPLVFVLKVIQSIQDFGQRPVFLTSTRRPHLEPEQVLGLDLLHVKGLSDEQ